MDASQIASNCDSERMRENEARWARLRALSDDVSANWPIGLSAADAVAEQRRDLAPSERPDKGEICDSTCSTN